MKRVSIKTFFATIIAIIFLIEIIIFTSFYQSNISTIKNLLYKNTKSNIEQLKHHIEKYIKFNDASNIIAYMDNFAASHKLIENIQIINNNNKILYSTKRDKIKFNPNKTCTDIIELSSNNILNTTCIKFKIKVYKHLEPHFYETYIYLDRNYMNYIIYHNLQDFIVLSILFALLSLIILWILFDKLIIIPLKELRNYAYYSENPPMDFFIKEFESIRYSLQMTFKRLKDKQHQLYTLSTRDLLTFLLNRKSLRDRINWLISNSKRTGKNFTLLFMDIDNFKTINDTFGHDFGDQVLKTIAKRLKKSLRENDIIARFGGDEYIIALPGVTEPLQIKEVVKKIQKQLKIPIKYKNFSFTPTASIGVVIYPQNGKSFEELLKNADAAMYKAKEKGKNSFSFFTNELEKELMEKIKTQELIKKALKEGNFQLYYQPQVDIKSQKIIGCEALIRLIDPNEGLIPPDKFIPIAEETNLILPIGRWLQKEAVKQIEIWENRELKDIKVSINMSALELNDKNLINRLKTYTSRINRKNLCIELTESILANDTESKIEKIHQIKELGFALSLDDFGTGYSSISYVKKLPFDYLKIDKSFVDDILIDPQDKIFIKVIIDMAKTLNLKTIAEGVENQEQLKILEDLGCDIYQGYLASKPLPADEFERFFLEWESKRVK